jgi:hypothetical protein
LPGRDNRFGTIDDGRLRFAIFPTSDVISLTSNSQAGSGENSSSHEQRRYIALLQFWHGVRNFFYSTSGRLQCGLRTNPVAVSGLLKEGPDGFRFVNDMSDRPAFAALAFELNKGMVLR